MKFNSKRSSSLNSVPLSIRTEKVRVHYKFGCCKDPHIYSNNSHGNQHASYEWIVRKNATQTRANNNVEWIMTWVRHYEATRLTPLRVLRTQRKRVIINVRKENSTYGYFGDYKWEREIIKTGNIKISHKVPCSN